MIAPNVPNPYAAPQEDPPKRSMVGASFSHQAALFSLCGPLAMMQLMLAVWAITGGWEGGVGAYFQALLSCASVIIYPLAFLLGLAGMFGGMLQGSGRTVAYAAGGITVSVGGFAALLIFAA